MQNSTYNKYQNRIFDKTLFILEKLYAIYKNKIHLGNQKGSNPEKAIENYIVASMLREFINDEEFLNQYQAMPAINGVHHHFVFSKKDLN